MSKNQASPSTNSADRDIWGEIWMNPVQPKVKHFLWQIIHNTLPCNVNLAGRIPEMSKLCPRCGVVEESQMHALKDCDVVRGLWLLSPLSLHIFSALKEEDVRTCILCLRTIWNNRNNMVFGNNRIPTASLFRQLPSQPGRKCLSERVSNALQPEAAPAWIPPPPNSRMINTDAAVSIRSNLSVISSVCRDFDGAVLRWGVSVFRGITDVEVAEAKAVLFGIRIAAILPCEALILEADSANVISRLNNPGSATNPTQLIIEDYFAETASRLVHYHMSDDIVM
ncbi:uncharacterized protein LOC126662013 [Mercurialis annua]|uniref:uncharacterized protein LOC126662013 n=1 Tax=Mercurialis annua TaxID=3986 RepID=UPI002160F8E4|nr:uncharacterized protein LOC126662013 [Mercurialis annua]